METAAHPRSLFMPRTFGMIVVTPTSSASSRTGVVKTFRCATYREYMGHPLWLTVLNVSVMPTLIGCSALFYLADWLDWTFGFTLLMFVPFWVFGFFVWCFGVCSVLAVIGRLGGNNVRHPPCPTCSEPLATQHAQQCLTCGADWHGDTDS